MINAAVSEYPQDFAKRSYFFSYPNPGFRNGFRHCELHVTVYDKTVYPALVPAGTATTELSKTRFERSIIA